MSVGGGSRQPEDLLLRLEYMFGQAKNVDSV